MKLTKNILIGFILCLSLFCMIALSAHNVKAAGIKFSVSPELSTDQAKGVTGYFDIKAKPGTTYPLKVRVSNSGDSKALVNAKINTAFTNDSVQVNYSENNLKHFDNSLKYPLSSLATNGSSLKVSVPAKSAVTSTFNVKVPDTQLKGSILGSLTFTSQPDAADGKGNVKISNAYSYSIPVMLKVGNEVDPNLKLINANGKVINGTNNFYARFQNNQPALMTGVKMSGAIYTADGYKNHEKPLYKVDKNDASIAPNSSFNYLMPTNGQAFKSGDYVYVGTVNWGKHHWKYTKDFHMSFTKAYKANNEATGVKSDYTWLWILLAALLVIIALIVTIIILFIKNKHNHK